MATPSSQDFFRGFLKVLIPILIILALIIGGLYIVKSEFSRPNAYEGAIIDVQVGNTLPDFTLSQIGGRKVKISDLNSKILMINFWASWCDACVNEMQSILKLREKYKERGFEVLGVNLDENPEIVLPRILGELKIDFPVFVDPENKISELFDVHAIPLTVILDKSRKILFIKDGEQNWDSPVIHSKLENWLAK